MDNEILTSLIFGGFVILETIIIGVIHLIGKKMDEKYHTPQYFDDDDNDF